MKKPGLALSVGKLLFAVAEDAQTGSRALCGGSSEMSSFHNDSDKSFYMF